MSTLVIRAAAHQDLDAIVAIERESFGDPWTAASFKELMGLTPGAVRVAAVDGTVVGFCIGQRVLDEADVQNIAVQGLWRRRGVGARLLEDFLRSVGAEQDTTVFLEVRASNEAAQRLYARYGFAHLDRRAAYYKNPDEDALVLARRPGPLPVPRHD